jgi:hypothetical protein
VRLRNMAAAGRFHILSIVDRHEHQHERAAKTLHSHRHDAQFPMLTPRDSGWTANAQQSRSRAVPFVCHDLRHRLEVSIAILMAIVMS